MRVRPKIKIKQVTEKLILIVSKHRQFGWKLSIHLAEISEEKGLLLKGVPKIEDEIQKGRTENEIKLIKKLNEASDETLLKLFSKEKDKSKLTQSTIDNLIKPKIEKINVQAIQIVRLTDISLYFRDDIKNKLITGYNQLGVRSAPSQSIFHFVKNQEGLHYFISLTNEGEEIPLPQDRAIVLSQKPCLIILGDEVHKVNDIDAAKLFPFFSKTHIDIPPSAEHTYIQKFVLKAISKYQTTIQGIDMERIFPKKEAVLVLEEDFQQQLCLSLFFHYDKIRIAYSEGRKKIVSLQETDGKDKIVWFIRDQEWEEKYLNLLVEAGLSRRGENRFYYDFTQNTSQRFGLINWMNDHSFELKEFVIEQKTGNSFYSGKVNIKSDLNVKIDWFDLNIEVVFDHFSIPFARFRKHILNNNPEFILPDGSIFILPEEWFTQYYDFFLYSEEKNGRLQVKKIFSSLLDESVDSLFLKDKKAEIENFIHTPLEYPVPTEKLDKILRPYQRRGFYWLNHLRKMNFGGCLADDMGLGKTLQIITLLESVYSKSEKREETSAFEEPFSLFTQTVSNVTASLIVVPTSLLHNWRNELKKFAPDLKVYIHAGIKRLKTSDIGKIFKHYQIVLTSYGTLRMDIDYLNDYEFEYVILDESQYIKNPHSVLYQSVSSLRSHHRLVLTGTPIENSLIDIWTQFNFINPGLLGSLSFFKENYINKIMKEEDKRTEQALHNILQPFLLRRTKEEVAPDLPPLSQEIVFCDMSEKQEKTYNEEKNSIRNTLLEYKEPVTKNKFIALQSLMKLRLLANHPALLKPEYEGDSGKFEQILLYFETIKASGHKVLIFSSFVKHLELLEKAFLERNWKYAMLTGQTQNREKEIEKFNQNPDVQAFFISLKAGGTGLNLTSADYVFIVDPWWNPAAEMQALSRAHRIGQDKNVMVYRFISTHSIEEKIIKLQERKSRLSETFITSQNPFKEMNSEDIEELLT